MTRTFIYSDPHFYHNNIIKYENRPFSSVEEMNETIIKNHNSIIKKKDWVFILGDFALAGKEATEKICNRLNGYKILIIGNHDKHRGIKAWLNLGFDEVYRFPVIIHNFFILSHIPMYINNNMPYLNIHGHTHGNSMKSDNFINVSLDVTNFMPLSLNKILEDCVIKLE